MSKPKDPEVVDEMRAAGNLPEDTAPGGETEPGKPAAGRKRAGKAEAVPAAAAAEDARPEGRVADDQKAEEQAAEDPGPEALREIIHDDHAEEHAHRSMAATALMILVGVLAVATATLWAAPRVAPHLPAGIAQYLMPGHMDTAGDIAALRQALADETARTEALISALGTRVEAAEGALGGVSGQTGDLPQAVAAAGDAAKAAAEALDLAGTAKAQADSLNAMVAGHMDKIDAEISGLRDSVSAVNAALAGGGGDGTAAPAELSAAVAALNARIDSLTAAVANRAEMRAMEQRIDGFGARLEAVETSAADARSVQTQALGEVSTAIHQASLRAAAASLTSQVEGGQPYAAPLGEIATLTGTQAPAPLASGSAAGLATAATLGSGFGPYAQAAIAADVRARAGGGTGSQVLGWLRAQVTGRPVSEQQGEGVAATTSRIAARVADEALAEALAEAESLPPDSQAALGPWLEQLRARVEAEAALSAWLAEIGING